MAFERTDVTLGFRPYNLEPADLDGDGDADMAVVGQAGSLAVVWNDGHGGFTASSIHEELARPEAVAAVDLDQDGRLDLVVAVDVDGDGDGRLDLATANDADDFVTILLNRTPASTQASGSFSPPARRR